MAGHWAISDLKRLLRPARRRLNQLLGRDLRYGAQLRCQTLRLGSDYGGWVICPGLLHRDSIVYSFGVGDDVSFDLELIARFGVKVHAFDPTPKAVRWVRGQALPAGFCFHEVGLADFDGVARFVLPRANNVSYHVDAPAPPTSPHAASTTTAPRAPHAPTADDNDNARGGRAAETIEAPVQRLTTIMRSLGHQRIDLLKMDIEGAEYAALADILRCTVEVDQLLVEFHHLAGDAASLARTRAAVQSLLAAGYRIFNVSATGLEYSFMSGKTARAVDLALQR